MPNSTGLARRRCASVARRGGERGAGGWRLPSGIALATVCAGLTLNRAPKRSYYAQVQPHCCVSGRRRRDPGVCRGCARAADDPHRRSAAGHRTVRQERHRELGGDADRPRHDQRTRRHQRPQDRVSAGRCDQPQRGDQRDRAADHQGRHQDHDRLICLAARHRGEPGSRAPWRVPLGDDRRRRDHHPARLQAHVPGRRAGAQVQRSGGGFRHRRSGEAAEQAGRRHAYRATVGKPRVRQVGRRRRPCLRRKQEDQARLRRRLRPVRHRHDADRAEAQGRQAGRPDRDIVSRTTPSCSSARPRRSTSTSAPSSA